jgi:hypothetical protein
MTTLKEINDRILEWNKPSGFTYEGKLYVDKKRNTATLYLNINDLVEIRFGFVDPYKTGISSDQLCYNINAILRETGQPVRDIDVALFCPVVGETDLWQINIEYDNETSDVEFLYPTGKTQDLVATTDAVNVLDLLKEEPTTNLSKFLNAIGSDTDPIPMTAAERRRQGKSANYK